MRYTNGSVVKLQFSSEKGAPISVTAQGLTGSLQSSTVNASVTLPIGYSLGYFTAQFQTTGK